MEPIILPSQRRTREISIRAMPLALFALIAFVADCSVASEPPSPPPSDHDAFDAEGAELERSGDDVRAQRMRSDIIRCTYECFEHGGSNDACMTLCDPWNGP